MGGVNSPTPKWDPNGFDPQPVGNLATSDEHPFLHRLLLRLFRLLIAVFRLSERLKLSDLFRRHGCGPMWADWLQRMVGFSLRDRKRRVCLHLFNPQRVLRVTKNAWQRPSGCNCGPTSRGIPHPTPLKHAGRLHMFMPVSCYCLCLQPKVGSGPCVPHPQDTRGCLPSG